ncbi:signal peptidase I [Streptomyces sp. NPDC048551]|uniref:signal peptidase I n=1 Tax=Streptomyces sp. NPDC048551 TaxID=3155758 RepID=UPI003438E9AF
MTERRERIPGRRLAVASAVTLALGAVVGGAGAIGGHFLMPAKTMTSRHMLPSYPVGRSVVFNLMAPGVMRGDVVLLDAAGWGNGGLTVERVVAVGGDRIAYAPGDRTLTLNGKPLDEPYVAGGDPVAGTPGAFSVTVPSGRLFLLGDNRLDSADSRYRLQETPGGTVSDTAVKGVAVDEGSPLVGAVRSVTFAGIALLAAGAVCGVLALRHRRRAARGTAYGPPPAG